MIGAARLGRATASRPMQLALLACVTLCCGLPAFGLDPTLDVSQYAHTAWRARDGFAKGEISGIAQAPDGYLWLGTEFGLYRFDGVRAVPWQPPSGLQLPSNEIKSLLVARDGTLWIGTQKGLASWKDGRLARYGELTGLPIVALLEDHEGSVWVAAYDLPAGKLCEIKSDDTHCYPEFSSYALGLHEDPRGNLWVGTPTGVWRWKPGRPDFYELPLAAEGYQGIVDAEDGGVLVSSAVGIRHLVAGKSELAFPLSPSVGRLARGMLRDRDGALWVRTVGGGIVHIHNGQTDIFSQSDGLTGSQLSSLFEDREGSIWAGTTKGIDRFRELPVVTYSSEQRVQRAPNAVVAGRDGSVWFTAAGLNRLNPRGPLASIQVGEIQSSGVPGREPGSLFQDSHGRLWVSVFGGETGYLKSGRFVHTAGPPKGFVTMLTEDDTGNLWIAYQDRGLVRVSGTGEVQEIPWDTFRHGGPGIPLFDPVHGGIWVGFRRGGVIYFRDGQVRASYSGAEGLPAGQVNQLRLDAQGALWIAAEGGLGRLKDGRAATLTSEDGLPCDTVLWSMEDNAQSVWLGMPCGLVRVARSELDAWASTEQRGSARGFSMHPTVFDSSEGATMPGGLGGIGPHVDKTPDGKIWFVTYDGLGMVDPRRPKYNKVPPPVHVEQIIADRKTYDSAVVGNKRWSLPPLVRDLEIDYTALSLVASERNQFRYKLEGRDRDWQDVGNRRQAFYSDLPPGNYRFRVVASNNSGVWNETGDSLDFSIAPTYYQTRWFGLSCVIAFLSLLWALYRYRLYQVRREFNVGLEERVGERTRIARELHDTLLQSFHGLMFQFQAVRNMLPQRTDEAIKTLDGAIRATENALAESRDAIHELRPKQSAERDLAQSLRGACEELAALQEGKPDLAAYRVVVEGHPRALQPTLQDEAYRIGREVIRNAFRHASAQCIEVEIRYDEQRLRLRIRDDGKGIDAATLQERRNTGHWGLSGMRERAERIGAQLSFWTEAGAGTEVELSIPSLIAYERRQDGSRFGLFRREGKHVRSS